MLCVIRLYVFILAILINITIMVTTPSVTRLLDSAPYNNLILTCTSRITVKAKEVPFKTTIIWFRSIDGGPTKTIASQFGFVEFGSIVTNTISITVTEAGIHGYICKATLDVSPAPDYITKETTMEVPVYG